MQAIHISQARKMLDSRQPVKLTLWTKDGQVQTWEQCVSLKYFFHFGTRTVKLLKSRQIRTMRDICIFKINDIEVNL